MTMFYSPSSKGFFSSDINYSNLPNDLIEVSETDYLKVLEGQTRLKIITLDSNSNLCLSDHIKTDGELAAEERTWRDAELLKADYELNKVQDGDNSSIGSVGDWRKYRIALRNWPESPDFPNATKRPVSPSTSSQP